MSKLDYTRQALPVGEHNGDIHDVISSLRTNPSLSSLSNNLMDNGHLGENSDSNRGFSPSLIDFEDCRTSPTDGVMLSRSNVDLSSQDVENDRPYFFKSLLENSSNSSHQPTTTTSNSLRRWYRRAQDVSLAAIPNLDWEDPPSPTYIPLTPSKSISEQHFFPQFLETKNQEQEQLSVSRQLTTLKTPSKPYQELPNVNSVNDLSSSSSIENWSDGRKRFLSYDSQTNIFNPNQRSITLETPVHSYSLPTSYEAPLNLKKQTIDGVVHNAIFQPDPVPEDTSFEVNYCQFNSEPNCYNGGNSYFSASTSNQTSPHEQNIFFSHFTGSDNGEEAYRKNSFLPFVSSSSAVTSQSEIKTEYEASTRLGNQNQSYQEQEEVGRTLLEKAVIKLFCNFS